MIPNLTIISAGAGSGKTYRLTNDMAKLLSEPDENGQLVRPTGILATTFTSKAAAELRERVRIRLLERGMSKEADALTQAMIGTVHAIGGQLLQRFAFEAGVSPDVTAIADEDQQIFFNQSLSATLSPELIDEMENLSVKLGFRSKSADFDWRSEVRTITEIARSNNLGGQALEQSKQYSIDTYRALLPQGPALDPAQYLTDLKVALADTQVALEDGDDDTLATLKVLDLVKQALRSIETKGNLAWEDIARLSKAAPGKKSREIVEPLQALLDKHLLHPEFMGDIERYIGLVFDISIAALAQYERFKKERGLIDFTDMETALLKLLQDDKVKAVLREELDLLLVDEFQDTNPIQLQIFLEITRLAKKAIWVGDPKQSIYGFRGAAPELMQAVMDSGKVDNLDTSWRSRADLVNSVNAIFVKAFPNMPPERVALKVAPKNEKIKEPLELDEAIMHWHFDFNGKKASNIEWFAECVVHNLLDTLNRGLHIRDKHSGALRLLEAGDVAILCRGNKECLLLSQVLAKAGIKASTAKNGLLQTREAVLLQACLNYIINDRDSLAVAEILKLADNQRLEHIIDHRIKFLALQDQTEQKLKWASENRIITQLAQLRQETEELSCSEIVNLVIESLDLYRIIATWGDTAQRFDNLDALRSYALQYEDACNRRHAAATLGGFLIWLNDLAEAGLDNQGAGAAKDAVQVLTYHKSKGLEWPLVICMSLEADLRDAVFGAQVVALKDEIDLEQPLANRLIRFWINPYGHNFQKTALANTLETHPVQLKASIAALQEEARLLYVGFTRAREYMVLPSRKKETAWLNRVWHGDDKTPSLIPQDTHCQWLWDGLEIPKQTTAHAFDQEIEMPKAQQSECVYFLPRRAGSKQHEPLFIDAAQDEQSTKQKQVKAGMLWSYANPFDEGMLEKDDVFKLLKAFLCVDDVNFNPAQREQRAKLTIAQLGMKQLAEPKDLIENSLQFYQSLSTNFGIQKVWQRYLVQGKIDKQQFSYQSDLLMETAQGICVFKFHDFAGPQINWRKKALDENKGIAWLDQLMEQQFPGKSVRYFSCFPVDGGMVELELYEA